MTETVNCPHCSTEVQVEASIENNGEQYYFAGVREDAKNATAYPVGNPPYTVSTSCRNKHRFHALYTASGEPVIS
ncbi:hypothetical protein [Haloplanus natans]|uniref:hypothetical protein n=1 Tax=Haloplanus natans TaxID=376171 RepID=UPI0012F77128|nr:hypothetical protein [Haloplanus natans]